MHRKVIAVLHDGGEVMTVSRVLPNKIVEVKDILTFLAKEANLEPTDIAEILIITSKEKIAIESLEFAETDIDGTEMDDDDEGGEEQEFEDD